MDGMLISIIVFLVVYVAITFELVNKAVAAFSGVAVLMLLHVIDEHQAIEFIDFETIMLLFGMMIIVSVLKYSGLFTIISVRISELTRGNPIKILVLFSVVTALMSAFLDNVTTVLIIIPIIILLVIIAGIFWFFNRKTVNEFSGNLVSIEGQEMVVSGVYLGDEIDDSIQEPRNVRVVITNETKIERISFNVPDTDETFNPSELPKEVSIINLDTLKDDTESNTLGFLITSKKNIYNKSRFEAEMISYFLPVFSDF